MGRNKIYYISPFDINYERNYLISIILKLYVDAFFSWIDSLDLFPIIFYTTLSSPLPVTSLISETIAVAIME